MIWSCVNFTNDSYCSVIEREQDQCSLTQLFLINYSRVVLIDSAPISTLKAVNATSVNQQEVSLHWGWNWFFKEALEDMVDRHSCVTEVEEIIPLLYLPAWCWGSARTPHGFSPRGLWGGARTGSSPAAGWTWAGPSSVMMRLRKNEPDQTKQRKLQFNMLSTDYTPGLVSHPLYKAEGL